MALTGAEIITLSEITGETIATVSGVAVDSDLETALKAEIETWNENRNEVEMIISGNRDGVDLKTQRLLDKITYRVRLWLGFPELKNDGACSLPGTMSLSSSVRW